MEILSKIMQFLGIEETEEVNKTELIVFGLGLIAFFVLLSMVGE